MGGRGGRRGRKGGGEAGSRAASPITDATALGTSAAALSATKVCPVCGLPFSNRKKWASRGLWPSIVYCSERCRRQRSS